MAESLNKSMPWGIGRFRDVWVEESELFGKICGYQRDYDLEYRRGEVWKPRVDKVLGIGLMDPASLSICPQE